MTYSVDALRCNGCGDRVPACLVDAIQIRERVALIDESECICCSECQVICPEGAVLYRGERRREIEIDYPPDLEADMNNT